MKVVNISVLIFVFVFKYGMSQTEKEKLEIISHYNIESIEALQKKIKKRSVERELRIVEYIEKQTISRIQNRDGKKYVLYDVVDNYPIYKTSNNTDSGIATRTNFLHNNGGLGLNLEGQNMTLGVWEIEQVLTSHVEFQNNDFPPVSRVSAPEFQAQNVGNHATHVAGTLIGKGDNASAKGMAPQASLVSYSHSNDTNEVITEAVTNGLLISNHSYGVTASYGGGLPAWLMGCYDEDAVIWDEIAFNFPYYLQVTSADNDGNYEYSGGLGVGYDKLTLDRNSKNNLVVANAYNPTVASDGSLISATINSDSSQGPSDDGRIKPDIAGDGTSVYSSKSSSVQSYGNFTGTSMSSPNVAGSLILLQQYYNELNAQYMRAATLKGLACGTADDDSSREGPDPFFGWGLLNAKAAAEVIQNSNTNSAILSELTLLEGETHSTVFYTSGGGPINVTICWTDPAGESQEDILNSPIPALVNDLDLRLHAPDGTTTYMPWKLQLSNLDAPAIKGDNTVDTVEKIEVETPAPGLYTIEVSHKSTLKDNLPQDFSLIATAPNFSLSTLDLSTDNLKIWPNPAKDKLYLNYKNASSKTKIKLYNIDGRKIYEAPLISTTLNHFVDLSVFSNGVYLLVIERDGSTFKRKIIIH